MITVKLIGGLGNQLFQYATGKAIATANGVELNLDVSAFEENNSPPLDIKNLNLELNFASKQEIQQLLPKNNLEKLKQRLTSLKKRIYYREKYFHFDKKVVHLGKNVYLKGYFQSEKYFLGIRNLLLKDFTPKINFTQTLIEIKHRIESTNSVSVHVRRGDFLNIKSTNSYHGTLSLEYYLNAIEIIKSNISNPSFYFFSDDINWVKENLLVENAVYVSGEFSKTNIEDLYLMSCCKHNIIANSSFSWWGAWLNENPEKIVIAPKRWFNKGPKDTQDLIPENWLKI